MHGKRIVAAKMGNGHIGLIEENIPDVVPGTILVEVHNSLISPGTELGGWRGLRKELDNPDLKAEPTPFGYSNAGVVAEVGAGVEEFKPGDRVACIGSGYALHTDYAVVPHNLCVLLPKPVSFAQGSYAMLAATALHALRRARPELGEYAAVVGLGLVGQLTAQLHQLAGNYVIGWDTIAFRTEIARKWGIHARAVLGQTDEVKASYLFTGGRGLDIGVLAFGGGANQAVESLENSLRRLPDGHPVGRIVVVGGARFSYKSTLTNVDIRRASRTGPGYHDPAWEVGPDYPPGLPRWTTRTNLQLCMRLIVEGKLNVDCLTTHVIPLADVDAGISAIIYGPDKILGVVLQMRD